MTPQLGNKIALKRFLDYSPQFNGVYKDVHFWPEWAADHWPRAIHLDIDFAAERRDGGLCAIRYDLPLIPLLQSEIIDFLDLTGISIMGSATFAERMVITDARTLALVKNAARGLKVPAILIDRAQVEPFNPFFWSSSEEKS